jgi:Phospholipid methyltransferase
VVQVSSGAEVRLIPPVVYFVPFALTWALQQRATMDNPRRRRVECGWVSPGSRRHRLDALVLCDHVAREHHRDPLGAGLGHRQYRPFRFSRSPIYLADAITYVGGSLLIHSWWPSLLPVIVVMISRMVIDREERYLSEGFCSAYREYQLRVRRWI